MVTLYEAQSAARNAAEDMQRKEALQAQLIEADLRVADLLVHEPSSIAAHDYEYLWRPRIVSAVGKSRHEVNNFPWVWPSRGSDEYIRALQEILGASGSPFTVEQKETVFGNLYTRIIW